jgi:hypothetical protein
MSQAEEYHQAAPRDLHESHTHSVAREAVPKDGPETPGKYILREDGSHWISVPAWWAEILESVRPAIMSR